LSASFARGRISQDRATGQFHTLKQVIDWFDRGGFAHTHLDTAMRPLDLTSDEKRELMAFHLALSGPLPPVETSRLPQIRENDDAE
jgi:cytochrome c peroxidase